MIYANVIFFKRKIKFLKKSAAKVRTLRRMYSKCDFYQNSDELLLHKLQLLGAL